MTDKTRLGRGVDDRDVVRRTADGRRTAEAAVARDGAAIERMGRESQRRAVAYGRARGVL